MADLMHLIIFEAHLTHLITLEAHLTHIIFLEAQTQRVKACSYIGVNIGCQICPMPGYDYKSILCSELCISTQQLRTDRTRKLVVFLFLCNNTLLLSFHQVD